MLEALTVKENYSLDQTIAKDIFNGVTYPWEVLPKISNFILELGATLSEDEYEKRGEKCMGSEVCKGCSDCIYQWTGNHRKGC